MTKENVIRNNRKKENFCGFFLRHVFGMNKTDILQKQYEEEAKKNPNIIRGSVEAMIKQYNIHNDIIYTFPNYCQTNLLIS